MNSNQFLYLGDRRFDSAARYNFEKNTRDGQVFTLVGVHWLDFQPARQGDVFSIQHPLHETGYNITRASTLACGDRSAVSD